MSCSLGVRPPDNSRDERNLTFMQETHIAVGIVIPAFLAVLFVWGTRAASRKVETLRGLDTVSLDDLMAAFLRLNIQDPVNTSTCDADCAAWERAQRATDSARRKASELQQLAESIASDLRTLLAHTAVLIAMAAAALLIPLIGAIVAAGFFAAASVLVARTVFLQGVLATVRGAYSASLEAVEAAENREREAFVQVQAHCGSDGAGRCGERIRDLQRASIRLAAPVDIHD